MNIHVERHSPRDGTKLKPRVGKFFGPSSCVRVNSISFRLIQELFNSPSTVFVPLAPRETIHMHANSSRRSCCYWQGNDFDVQIGKTFAASHRHDYFATQNKGESVVIICSMITGIGN